MPIILKKLVIFLLIVSIAAIACAAPIQDIKKYTNKGNDLSEFFIPLIIYTKNSIKTDHVFPLWNQMWFGGQPLIADPQNPANYFPNLIYLLVEIETGILLLIFLHIFIGSIALYKLLRALKCSPTASLLGVAVYILSPKLASAIEAGHMGIIYAWSLAPVFFLLIQKFLKKHSIYLFFLSSIVFWLIMTAHLVTAAYIGAFAFIFVIILKRNKNIVAPALSLLAIAILSIMLYSPTLLPFLRWQPNTNREILLSRPDIYPKWNSKREFVFQLAVNNVRDTEKQITLGFGVSIFSALTILKIRRRRKIFSIIFLVILFTLVANNLTPFSKYISTNNFLALSRVTTRSIIIVFAMCAFFAANFIDTIGKKKIKALLFVFVVTEIVINNRAVFQNQNLTPRNFVESDLVQTLSPNFRAYCEELCISQKDAAATGVYLANGYATLMQKNYFSKSWGLFGGYWDYYSLAIPPFGIKSTQKLSANDEILGEFNTKHIIKIENRKVVYRENKLAKGLVYETDYTSSRDLPIIYKNANLVRVDTREVTKPHIVLSQIFSQGWKAKTDNDKIIEVLENPSSLSQINTPRGFTTFIDFYYEPPGLKPGIILFLAAIAIIFLGTSTKLAKTHKYLKIFAILAISTTCGLFMLESLLRATSKLNNLTTISWRDDPYVGRRLKSNQVGLFVSPTNEYREVISINKYGFRGEEPGERQQNVKRVVLLGDSFVENFQASDGATLSELIKDNILKSTRAKLEVFPLGLGDSGSFQQYILLRNYLRLYSPDLVVQLFFLGNDVKNNSYELCGDPHRPYPDHQVFTLRSDNDFYKPVLQIKNNLLVVNTLLQAKARLLELKSAKGIPIDYLVYKKEIDNSYKRAWELTVESLIRTKNYLSGLGIDYAIAFLPANEQVNPITIKNLKAKYPELFSDKFDLLLPNKILSDKCYSTIKVKCTDMYEEFKNAADRGAATHYTYDGHLTPQGNEIAAGHIAKEIKDYLKIR